MSQSRSAMRSTEESRVGWVPVVVLLTALGIGCALLGAYFVAPLLGDPSAAPAPEPQMAAAPPTLPSRPAAVFPSGQNAVRIEEKPVTPPKEAQEPGITTSIESQPDEAPASDARNGTIDEAGNDGRGGKRGGAKPANDAGSAAEPGGKQETASPAKGERSEPSTGDASTPATVGRDPAAPEAGAPAASGTSPSAAPGSTGADAGAGSARPAGPMYRVQVGHFAEEKDAQALKDELGRIGFTPTVVRSSRDGQTLYRVQIGTFRRRENADKTIDQLRQRQFEPYLAEDEP